MLRHVGINVGMTSANCIAAFTYRWPTEWSIWRPLNALLSLVIMPTIGFLGPAIAGLFAGSFVVETIFQINGIGRYYVQAAFNRDYTLILGISILITFFTLTFVLLSDILATYLNPRLREKGSMN